MRIIRSTLMGLSAIVCLFLTTAITHCQQMEMRQAELFDAEKFARTQPAVGESAPALELQTLDGRTVKLSDYCGKTTVLIKAGYT